MMKIEELNNLSWRLDRHWEYGISKETKDQLDVLINAEIERLSVTDEAIADLIGVLERCETMVVLYPSSRADIKPERHQLIIDALRQMRTEPCEWQLSCGYEEFEEHITECGVVFTFIGDEMKSIHYCPNCGRKLVTE